MPIHKYLEVSTAHMFVVYKSHILLAVTFRKFGDTSLYVRFVNYCIECICHFDLLGEDFLALVNSIEFFLVYNFLVQLCCVNILNVLTHFYSLNPPIYYLLINFVFFIFERNLRYIN